MSDAPGGEARRKWMALAVLLALAVPLIVVALLTSGGDSPLAGGLRIERDAAQGTGGSLTVYVEEPARNVPATAGGKTTVQLECLDAKDALVRRSTHPWPFGDTDDGTLDPHVHERLPQQQAGRVARCRLAGTDGPLEGRVAARRG